MKSVGQKLVRELKHEATADQIAQKLHGATDPQYCRAQDIIDLQLMLSREKVDYAEIKDICKRLFANRRRQTWPSKVVATKEWRVAYDRTKGTLPVLPTIDEAVVWTNELMDAIDKSKSRPSKKISRSQMTIVLDSHKRIRSGEVSSTLTTKCNVEILDVYSVEEGEESLAQVPVQELPTFN